MLSRSDSALPPFKQAERKPTRREQRKLDQQAQQEKDAKREARERKQGRDRVRRWRIRMKAKTKPKQPRLTMAALAKIVGVSRWTLQRVGVRAEMFHGVERKSAKLSWESAIKVVQDALLHRGRKPLRHSVNLEKSVTLKWCRHAYARQDFEHRVNACAAPFPVAAAPQTGSPHLLAGLAVPSTREPQHAPPTAFPAAASGSTNGHLDQRPCRLDQTMKIEMQRAEVFNAAEAWWWPLSGNGMDAVLYDASEGSLSASELRH